jgi:hypothetical protein
VHRFVLKIVLKIVFKIAGVEDVNISLRNCPTVSLRFFTGNVNSVLVLIRFKHLKCLHKIQKNRHYDKKFKNTKTLEIYQLENEIYVTDCDTMQNCDTFVTPKVVKFIGPCKDGQRPGRGTY